MALNSIIFIQRSFLMIYIGIDVAKDKHDCFITNSDGEILFNPFTISNNREGFETLFQRIKSVAEDFSKIKSRTRSHWTLQLQSSGISS